MTENPAALPLDNERVAARLEEVAELLEAQHANPFRVRAYRSGARMLRSLTQPVHELLDSGGIESLRRLPGIGHSLARSIDRLVSTGHLGLLDRLRGESGAGDVFMTVPGIGPELARRIHEELRIETLMDLEATAQDGRLERVPGMGRRRLLAVRESLAGRFSSQRRVTEPWPQQDSLVEPPVAELLDVDREYVLRARQGRLPRIAPRRFNPTRDAWLAILHTHRGDRHYTALFSNTARAHELGMTHDWVVLYRDDHAGEGQWTVVTARYGILRGRRIVRGREADCRAHYEDLERVRARRAAAPAAPAAPAAAPAAAPGAG